MPTSTLSGEAERPQVADAVIEAQNGEHEGFDSTPTREHMCRVGRDEPVDNGGDFQAL